MINDKKLICAFIYSAYASGYCGLNLNDKLKMTHMKLYKEYIKNGEYFPGTEIDGTQKKMMDLVDSTDVRDYIYGGHFDVVKERISEETSMNFDNAIRSSIILLPAISCPVAFYEVIENEENNIVGRNLFLSKLEKKLNVLDGLEKPKVGDIVSGHWDYFLENLTDWKDLEKYKKTSKVYLESLKRANKK